MIVVIIVLATIMAFMILFAYCAIMLSKEDNNYGKRKNSNKRHKVQ